MYIKASYHNEHGKPTGKHYTFKVVNGLNLNVGDTVVCETRGWYQVMSVQQLLADTPYLEAQKNLKHCVAKIDSAIEDQSTQHKKETTIIRDDIYDPAFDWGRINVNPMPRNKARQPFVSSHQYGKTATQSMMEAAARQNRYATGAKPVGDKYIYHKDDPLIDVRRKFELSDKAKAHLMKKHDTIDIEEAWEKQVKAVANVLCKSKGKTTQAQIDEVMEAHRASPDWGKSMFEDMTRVDIDEALKQAFEAMPGPEDGMNDILATFRREMPHLYEKYYGRGAATQEIDEEMEAERINNDDRDETDIAEDEA